MTASLSKRLLSLSVMTGDLLSTEPGVGVGVVCSEPDCCSVSSSCIEEASGGGGAIGSRDLEIVMERCAVLARCATGGLGV
jgi:hypothetical protein